MKYRRRVDIVADILRTAENGARKTRIMYVANLSYMLLEKYLGETVSIGLMRVNGNGYEVTEKGRTFLERYEQFLSKYAGLEGKLEDMHYERAVLERMCERNGDVDPKPEAGGKDKR